MSPSRNSRRQPLAPWVFLAPFALTFLIFTAWPLVQSLLLAFEQTYGPKRSAFVGLANFQAMFQDPLFWKALRNTATYTVCTLCLQLPMSLGLALLLNRSNLRGRALWRLIFFAPSLVGLVFVGIVFSLLFQARTGMINQLLHTVFPAFDPEFAWTQDYVMTSLVLAALWMYVGFNMIYFLAALQNVPRDLIEAAEIDGAGPWHRFVHVTLPAIRPVAGFVTLLAIIGSSQLFELPWVLLNNSAGPDNRGLSIVMYLYQQGFVTGDLGYASAIGWLLALILMSVAWVQRSVSRAETD